MRSPQSAIRTFNKLGHLNEHPCQTTIRNGSGVDIVTDSYFVASEGVLGLRTNAPGVKWSWGTNMPEASRDQYEKCVVKVRFSVLDETPAGPDPDSDGFGKYHYFHGAPDADDLFYRRTFMGRKDLWLRLSGLVADEIHLEVNRSYARYITHRFMNLHSPGYILTDVVAWALLRSGLAPVHCSGFSTPEGTVLVLAPPNTGKTLTTMMACMNRGAGYLAEDVGITDGKSLFSVPWTSTFRYYDQIDSSRRSRALNRLTKVFPPAELLPVSKSSRIDDLLTSSKILTSERVTHVAVLERNENEAVVPLDRDKAVSKAVNLNRYEFNYMKSPVMVAYEYFNPDLDLSGALDRERSVLNDVVRQADQTLLIQTRDATRYADLIIANLGEE